MFNYRAVSSLSQDILSSKAGLEVEAEYYDREDSIEISKLGVMAPLVSVEGPEASDGKILQDKLLEGALIYPGSALPGLPGQTLVLGHSAPPDWPKIKYFWIFSKISELEKGDEIVVFFDNKKLVYSVTEKYFLERGQEVPAHDPQDHRSVLLLISCWPPGQDIRRIAVEAELEEK